MDEAEKKKNMSITAEKKMANDDTIIEPEYSYLFKCHFCGKKYEIPAADIMHPSADGFFFRIVTDEDSQISWQRLFSCRGCTEKFLTEAYLREIVAKTQLMELPAEKILQKQKKEKETDKKKNVEEDVDVRDISH